jgi:hypothetical protein
MQMNGLYNSVKLKKDLKREMVLDRLRELGVNQSQEGKPIQKVTYQELLTELVLAEMRQVDIDHPDHVWFR